MRKKTIKFYFFNSQYKNPAVNSLFSFSKRAMKQRKKNIKFKKLIKNTWNKKKRLELIEHYTQYMSLVKKRIMLNQWSYNDNILYTIFLNSFYLNNSTMSRIFGRKNAFKKKLLLWFFFKLRYQRRLHKRLNRYTFLGYLSSHFVHTCARKNLTYQNRSKFRSKVYNTNIFSAYMYTCSRMLLVYNTLTQNSVYFFTANSSKRYLWVDEDFYTQSSDWMVLNDTSLEGSISKRSLLFPINPSGYGLTDISAVMSCKNLLQQFFDETDKTKKDNLWLDITSKIDANLLDLIPYLYKMIAVAETKDVEWHSHQLLSFIKQYRQLYIS